MILFYFPDKRIHQVIPRFGAVSEMDGEYWIDDWNTTTRASDVGWKYIADQRLETDEDGAYLYDADYYAEATKPVTIEELQEQLASTNAILLDLYLGV